MKDEEAQDLLSKLASDIPVSQMPNFRVATDQTARHRGGRLAILGTVAATALAVVGIYALQQQQVDPIDVVAGPASTDLPSAPPGFSLVGRNQVVVTVPDQWPTEIGGCYDLPLQSRVFFPGLENPSCAGERPDGTTSVSIYDSRSNGVTGLVAEASEPATINGLELLRTPTESPAEGGIAEGVVVVPSQNTLIWVTSSDSQMVDQILESTSPLPEGHLAIPVSEGKWQTSREEMEAAGLRVEVQMQEDHQAAYGQLIGTRPGPGTVVETGSTVLLVAADGK